MSQKITSQLVKKLSKIPPPLKPKSKKGQSGRVAVVGGSFQFTGSPYYSAIAALRTGCDLSHIFCSKFSSPVIKSYSPQIIVHPVFVSSQEIKLQLSQKQKMLQIWNSQIKKWQKAIHTWIIGPGLGRDSYMNQFFPKLIKNLPNNSNLILDADGIFYLSQNPNLFNQIQRFKTILTPNQKQLCLIKKHMSIDIEQIIKANNSNQQIVQFQYKNKNNLKNMSIIIKGSQDIILSQNKSFIVRTEGGTKRCGGLGDILTGVLAVCSAWDRDYGLPLASKIVRMATKNAYLQQGRGMTAPLVINNLTKSIKQLQFFS